MNSNPQLGITHLPSAAAELQAGLPRAILNVFLHIVKPTLVGIVSKPQPDVCSSGRSEWRKFCSSACVASNESCCHLLISPTDFSPAAVRRPEEKGGEGGKMPGIGMKVLGSGLLLCQYKCQSSCVLGWGWEGGGGGGGAGKPCISGKSPLLQPHKSLLPARSAATLLLCCVRRSDRNLLTSRLCWCLCFISLCSSLLTPALHRSSKWSSAFFPWPSDHFFLKQDFSAFYSNPPPSVSCLCINLWCTVKWPYCTRFYTWVGCIISVLCSLLCRLITR